LGTHWELDENTLGTTKIQQPVTLPEKGAKKKNPHIKIDLLPKGQIPLSYYSL